MKDLPDEIKYHIFSYLIKRCSTCLHKISCVDDNYKGTIIVFCSSKCLNDYFMYA